jgi:hypothetical protein
MVVSSARKKQDDSKWFFFTLLFLVVDYGRPQDYLPIGSLRPAMLVILVLTIYLVSRKGFIRSDSKQTRMIWYFLLLLAIFVPFARNNYWAYQATTNMLAYMPFILSTVILVNTVKRLRIIITVYIVLMIYISYYSLTHGGKGSGNYFMDENDVSLYINMWLPFCFFLFLYEKDKFKKLFYLLGVVVGLAAVVVSFSRGGFVGLVSVAVVIWLFSPKKMLSLTLIIIAALILYFSTSEEYKQEMSTVTDTDSGTASDRMKSWATAWDMFIDNPFGVGGNNFAARFSEYQGDRFKRGMWGRVAHSLWFTLIPELGIIGIFIYFRLLYYNLKDIFVVKKMQAGNDLDHKYLYALSLAMLASLAGYFASATFISVLYYPHYWYMTGLIVALANISGKYYSGSSRSQVHEA